MKQRECRGRSNDGGGVEAVVGEEIPSPQGHSGCETTDCDFPGVAVMGLCEKSEVKKRDWEIISKHFSEHSAVWGTRWCGRKSGRSLCSATIPRRWQRYGSFTLCTQKNRMPDASLIVSARYIIVFQGELLETYMATKLTTIITRLMIQTVPASSARITESIVSTSETQNGRLAAA